MNRFQHDVEHTSSRVDWERLKNCGVEIKGLSWEPQKGSTLEISFTPLIKHWAISKRDCPFTADNSVMTIIGRPTSDISITITVQTNMMCWCVVSVYIGHWAVLHHLIIGNWSYTDKTITLQMHSWDFYIVRQFIYFYCDCIILPVPAKICNVLHLSIKSQ